MPPEPKLQTLIDELRRLNRSRKRVHSYSLACALEVSDRTIRLWLRALEVEKIVARPNGVRSGWVLIA